MPEPGNPRDFWPLEIVPSASPSKSRDERDRRHGYPSGTLAPGGDCSLRAVYARDRGICWLCLGPVDWAATSVHARASRDHVIPLRDDGPTIESNLRLAHAYCNSVRAHLHPSALVGALAAKLAHEESAAGRLARYAVPMRRRQGNPADVVGVPPEWRGPGVSSRKSAPLFPNKPPLRVPLQSGSKVSIVNGSLVIKGGRRSKKKTKRHSEGSCAKKRAFARFNWMDQMVRHSTV